MLSRTLLLSGLAVLGGAVLLLLLWPEEKSRPIRETGRRPTAEATPAPPSIEPELLGRAEAPVDDGRPGRLLVVDREREGNGRPIVLTEAVLDLTERLWNADEGEARHLIRRLLGLTRRLGAAMDARVRARLLELVTDLEPVVLRASVAHALAAGGRDPETARCLTVDLHGRDLDAQTHAAICTALAGVGGPDVVPNLLQSLESDVGARAAAVAYALGRIGGEQAEQSLIALLRGDIEVHARQAVEEACAGLRSETLAKRLDASLLEAQPEVAASLLRVIEKRGDARHAPAVLAVLDRCEDDAVQEEGIRTLATFGDEKSVERLLRTAARDGPRGRQAAASLCRLRTCEALDQAAGAWDTLGRGGRRALLQAAGRLARPPAALVQAAERALEGQDPGLRAKAVEVLGRRGNDRAVDGIAAFLADEENRQGRLAALHGLRRIGTRKAARVALDHIERAPTPANRSLQSVFEAALGQPRKRYR